MTISIAGFDLSKGGVEGPSGLAVDGVRSVQPAEFVRGDETEFLPRANRKINITFSVARLFDTVEDAEKFCVEHELEVPDSGLVTITAGSEGNVVSRYLNGCVEKVRNTHSGVTVFTDYSLLCGAVMKVKPTTP